MYNLDMKSDHNQAMYMKIVFLNFNKQNVMPIVGRYDGDGG
jgi:hypothetical protein